MSEFSGTQVGADGKRHAVADVADFDKVRAHPAERGVDITLFQGDAVASSGHGDPYEVGDRDEARFDIAVTGLHGGTNEVQTITLANATGGTFTLTYSGQTTSAIAYNATAATVQAALEALSNIAVGDVAVTGSAGGPYTVTFQGALGYQNVAQMTASGGSLTGSSPTVTPATQTAGAGPTVSVTATVETCSTVAGSYASVASFSAHSTVTTEHKVFSGLDEFVRVSYTISGVGTIDFAVTGELV